jgi:hypothetical protein
LEIQLERGKGIPLTGLTPPHLFCVCAKPGRTGFPTSYAVMFFFFAFSDFRREVIARFVDIGVIDDYHCLNFLFTTE